jgi:Tol biopolymer transport system component
MDEMYKFSLTFLFIISLLSCKNESINYKMKFLTEVIPTSNPIEFKKGLAPENKRIHKGIFSPDLAAYYYTISDKDFQNFDVFVIRKNDTQWSAPKSAFFNSIYDEHGMSFSPDGNTLYFSSTRPVNISGIPSTWHIWKSDLVNGQWSDPSFVDIPNMRDKLVSHPTITNSGDLYFHASNLDYSEMDIYTSKHVNNKFAEAKKVSISMLSNSIRCTPYISPDGDYLIFASLGNQLDLYLTFNDGEGDWTKTKRLSNKINSAGQGNPYVTPDHQFLFFTTGESQEETWKVQWVHIGSELKSGR